MLETHMDELERYAQEYGINLSENMLDEFALFEKYMLEYNEKVNLTAITGHSEILKKHFLDSLLVLKAACIPQGAGLIDIGTGAGFPGIPLKIARPDIRLTLLDSLNKRVIYLENVSGMLSQDNECVHARAEEAAHDPKLREGFDFAVSRAVAYLPALCEYSLAFVKKGGCFLAMKASDTGEEINASKNAVKEMGAVIEDVRSFNLPDGDGRCVIIIRKISQTSPKYPRKAVKITKDPL